MGLFLLSSLWLEWEAQSFNFPRRFAILWRVRTMLVCFYGSYRERNLVLRWKAKQLEWKWEMAPVHVLWILYKVPLAAVFSLEVCCKTVPCKTCNCECPYYIGSYCLNVEKTMELLFSAIIFWPQKLKHISYRSIRNDDDNEKILMIILK